MDSLPSIIKKRKAGLFLKGSTMPPNYAKVTKGGSVVIAGSKKTKATNKKTVSTVAESKKKAAPKKGGAIKIAGAYTRLSPEERERRNQEKFLATCNRIVLDENSDAFNKRLRTLALKRFDKEFKAAGGDMSIFSKKEATLITKAHSFVVAANNVKSHSRAHVRNVAKDVIEKLKNYINIFMATELTGNLALPDKIALAIRDEIDSKIFKPVLLTKIKKIIKSDGDVISKNNVKKNIEHVSDETYGNEEDDGNDETYGNEEDDGNDETYGNEEDEYDE